MHSEEKPVELTYKASIAQDTGEVRPQLSMDYGIALVTHNGLVGLEGRRLDTRNGRANTWRQYPSFGSLDDFGPPT
jgi:hypothetical protein